MINLNDDKMQSYLLGFSGGQGKDDIYIPKAQVVKAYTVLLSPDKMYDVWIKSSIAATTPHPDNPQSKEDVLEAMDEQYDALSAIVFDVFLENKIIHIGDLSIWATEVEEI